MDERSRISKSIYEAVACLPTVVCNLIADYGRRHPHTWTVADLPPNQAKIRRTTTETELTVRSTKDDFYRLVSDRSLSDGDLEWNIEFEVDTVYNEAVCNWMSVGVTTDQTNRQKRTYETADRSTSWLLQTGIISKSYADASGVSLYLQTPSADEQLIYLAPTEDDLDMDEPVPDRYAATTRIRLWFTADADAGTISARWSSNELKASREEQTYGDENEEYWNLSKTDNDDDDGRPNFGDLRPCIFFRGSAAIVVRSGSNGIRGFPSDSDDIVLVDAVV